MDLEKPLSHWEECCLDPSFAPLFLYESCWRSGPSGSSPSKEKKEKPVQIVDGRDFLVGPWGAKIETSGLQGLACGQGPLGSVSALLLEKGGQEEFRHLL